MAFCRFFACLTQTCKTLVTSTLLWHAYIYVIDHDLSFVYVFFNNHVTVPLKKKKKQLKSSSTIALPWHNSAIFFIRSEDSPMHFSFNRSKKVRDVDIQVFNTSAKLCTFLAHHKLLSKIQLLHTLLLYPGLNLPVQ